MTGFGFIAIAVAAVILFVLHLMQLTNLKKYLRQPGPHSSKDYHSRPTRIFWPMVNKYSFFVYFILITPNQVTYKIFIFHDGFYWPTHNFRCNIQNNNVANMVIIVTLGSVEVSDLALYFAK